jgi:hypothetical protein
MNFRSQAAFVAAGFDGFIAVRQLRRNTDQIPSQRGIYVVLRLANSPPRFRKRSSAGHHKRRDPTVEVGTLRRAWIADTCLLYIGKAGGKTQRSTLQSRVSAYLRQGNGGNAGHAGGRAIWQLTDASSLVIAWKVIPRGNPRVHEKELIARFKLVYQRRPFANRTG